MNRKKALEDFTILTNGIQAGVSDQEASRVVDLMLEDVRVIQETNKKPPCPDCRARRLCTRDLAVPIVTNCELCGKRIIFLVPVESQESDRWNNPVSRISDLCPRARPKTNFAWCPTCRKYPDQVEKINKFKESRKENVP